MSQWASYIHALPIRPTMELATETEMAAFIKEHIHEARRVLEVGCSNGRWLQWFIDEYYNCEAHGIDLDPSGFVNPNIRYRKADAFAMPYEDSFFDVVSSFGFIEHFNERNQLALFREQGRVLKDGGFIVCEIPNGKSVGYLSLKLKDIVRGAPPWSRMCIEEIENLAVLSGFRTVAAKEVGWYPQEAPIPKRFRVVPRFTRSKVLSPYAVYIGRKEA